MAARFEALVLAALAAGAAYAQQAMLMQCSSSLVAQQLWKYDAQASQIALVSRWA